MQVKKALITAAGPDQRKLAFQTLVSRDGTRKTVMELLVAEARQAGIEEIAIVIQPGDTDVYRNQFPNEGHLQFIEQDQQRGYGYAVWCGAEFIGSDYFLHMVGDHLCVNRTASSCAKQLVDKAIQYQCSVSAVTQTREHLIPNFGTIGGKRAHSTGDLFMIERVIEKPTPTLAEQKLIIPGLRAGHYLCFFGMHVLSPGVLGVLEKQLASTKNKSAGLSEALNELAALEQYMAFEMNDLRFDIGSRYGLLKAQLALALSGDDRDQVMAELLEFFALKNTLTNGN